MRSKKVHVVTGAPVCEVGCCQRRGELHGRLRQERCAGVRRVRGKNGTGRPAFGMVLREHLLRVRMRGAAHALPATRPSRESRAGRNTRRRALPLAYCFQTLPQQLLSSGLEDAGAVVGVSSPGASDAGRGEARLAHSTSAPWQGGAKRLSASCIDRPVSSRLDTIALALAWKSTLTMVALNKRPLWGMPPPAWKAEVSPAQRARPGSSA